MGGQCFHPHFAEEEIGAVSRKEAEPGLGCGQLWWLPFLPLPQAHPGLGLGGHAASAKDTFLPGIHTPEEPASQPPDKACCLVRAQEIAITPENTESEK